MITNFKIFENESSPEYAKTAKKGDILVCIREPNEHDSKEMQEDIKMNDRYQIISVDKPEPGDVQYYYFDLIRLRTGNVIKGYGARLFKPEYEYHQDKYNL